MLRLEKFSRHYGPRTVLQNIDLHLKSGEVICIMGPNGAGKTSLIEAVLSHNRPQGARLFFKGSEVQTIDDHNQFLARCAYLGHEPGLLYDLTAIENLRFFADFHCARPPSRNHLESILAFVDLSFRKNDKARTFSRGMRQRLGLARSMLHDADLSLFDEPLTGLDSQGVSMLVQLLRRIKDCKKSALIVTHDDQPFTGVADRYLFINNGQIIADIASDRYTDQAKQHIALLISKDAVVGR